MLLLIVFTVNGVSSKMTKAEWWHLKNENIHGDNITISENTIGHIEAKTIHQSNEKNTLKIDLKKKSKNTISFYSPTKLKISSINGFYDNYLESYVYEFNNIENDFQYEISSRDLTYNGLVKYDILVENENGKILLDPSVNITGCVNTPTEIQCMNATFTGNEIIADNKDILIKDAIFTCSGTAGSAGNPPTSGTGGAATINNNQTIKIINTTFNCNGGAGGSWTACGGSCMNTCSGGSKACGAGGGSELFIKSRVLDMQNVTFNVVGGASVSVTGICLGSGCSTYPVGGWSKVNITTEQLNNMSDINIINNAGAGNGDAGTGNISNFAFIYTNFSENYNPSRKSIFYRNTWSSTSGSIGTTWSLNYLNPTQPTIFDYLSLTTSTGTCIFNVSSTVAFRNNSVLSLSGTNTFYLNNPSPNYGIGWFDTTTTDTYTINFANTSILYRGGFSDPGTVSYGLSINKSFTDNQFFRAVNATSPSITNVYYSPSNPNAGQNVSCNYSSPTLSGQTIVDSYIWWHNTTKYASMGNTFNGSLTGTQDSLQCQVHLTDGLLNATDVNGTQIGFNDLYSPSIISLTMNISTTVWYNTTVLYTVNCTDNQSNLDAIIGTVNGANSSFSFTAGKSVLATLGYVPSSPNNYNLTHIFCKDGTGRGITNKTTLMNFTALMPPPPTISFYEINPTTAIFNSYFMINTTCVDNNVNVQQIIATVERPSGVLENVTLPLTYNSGTISANYSYLADAVGTYNVSNIFCINDKLNSTSNLSQLLYIASNTPTPSPSGGGGGGGTIIGNPFLDLFGTTILNMVFLTPPASDKFLVRFKNTGNGTISNGKIEISKELSQYVTAQVCDVEVLTCEDSFVMSEGETKILKININADETVGEGIQGTVSVVDNSRNEKYEIVVSISRPPAYKLIEELHNISGLNLQISAGLVYLGILGSVGGVLFVLGKI